MLGCYEKHKFIKSRRYSVIRWLFKGGINCKSTYKIILDKILKINTMIVVQQIFKQLNWKEVARPKHFKVLFVNEKRN